MTFKNYLLFACMLLHCHLAIGQALPEPSLDQKTTELINQLYTVENFQARLGTKLDENQLFQTYQKEEAFYLDLVGLLRESALSAYATTIETAITTEMTEPQIDSLILALQSPYGNVIRKAFEIDNIRIDQQLDDYIDEVMNKAVEKRQVRDSLLYVTEFETDLKNMMDGTYTNMIADDKVVQIIRAGNQQLEVLNETELNYNIEWVANNRYEMVDADDDPCNFDEKDVLITIYKIEGDDFHFLVQFPNGRYERSILSKTSYTSYNQEIQTFQVGLNEKYGNVLTSPLSELQVEAFRELGGHTFFDLDKTYKVEVDLQLFEQPEIIAMPTSSGSEAIYEEYGRVRFTLNGEHQTLIIYRNIELDEAGKQSDELFIPFRDLTSGKETYGGGRYIDMKIPESGKPFVIDFNKAYHPYCAYAEGYACPIPPAVNTLTTRIEAGIQLIDLK